MDVPARQKYFLHFELYQKNLQAQVPLMKEWRRNLHKKSTKCQRTLPGNIYTGMVWKYREDLHSKCSLDNTIVEEWIYIEQIASKERCILYVDQQY